MAQLMRFLSFIVNIYMMIIFFRIILTWFSGINHGGIQNVLARITDPYLNWFRRFPALRIGYLDLSPLVALGVLSLANRIFATIAHYNAISIGIILALVLQVLWGAVSFILGLLIIVLILRLVAHLANFNTYNPFWRVVDTISQPVLYRINRTLFKDRILNYTTSVVLSIVGLGLIYFVMRILIFSVSGLLVRLPV